MPSSLSIGLFLKRYAEGAYELVWYFVPPERVAK